MTATDNHLPATRPEDLADFFLQRADLLASRPVFTAAGQRPVLRNGDIALASTRLPDGGTTVEVACRQPDGTWLWAIDQPSLLSS